MYSFEYRRPTSVSDAVEAAAEADSAFIAGGMTLLPALKLRLSRRARLVDLGRLSDLAGIRVDEGSIEVGALTRHIDVADSPEVRRSLPALASLAAGIGDPQVRNRGTIGGSIANNDPAADYPASAVALGATIVTHSRTIPAEQFFTGMFATALEPGELVTAVRFPLPRRAVYVKFPNPASRYAVVGVFLAETERGVRVAVTGAGPCVFRVTEFEQALESDFRAEALSGIAVSSEGLNDDMHGSAAYRASLIGVMTRRAVAALSSL